MNRKTNSRMTISAALLIVAGVLVPTSHLAADDYVVDTGQNKCCDDSGGITPPEPGEPFYGQDAQYAGAQPSYTISGDGLTVYDNNTGLT